MKNLSKSRYTLFRQCPKALWLRIYNPDVATEDKALEARFEEGNVVGDLAMGYLGPFEEVTANNPDGSLDLSEMCRRTRDCMDRGVENIAEASFSWDGNYCAVDILHKTTGGWSIYEVKSSSGTADQPADDPDYVKYARDIAYQKYVLEQCGVKVTGTYLVRIDKKYVRGDQLDIKGLFYKADLAVLVQQEYQVVPQMIAAAKRTLAGPEPDIDLGLHCHDPYNCAFWDYCTRHLPKPSVFNVYGGKGRGGFTFRKKLDHYKNGIITFEDLRNEDIGCIQNMQIECTLEDRDHINPEGIKAFLDQLTYPLYILDFETQQDAVPQYPGTTPYQQVPFQYSLHIIEYEGGPLLHKEFLGISGQDPRRDIAEALCRDIPENVCTLAYNKDFECSRLRELANTFPDLADHLRNIADNIQDLIDPFRAGDYYVTAMGGSFSIKSVLPALFPGDPQLDYHALSGLCQNGGDAMNLFPSIAKMSPAEAAAAREALLRYCELDTLAMVKVWEKLKFILGQYTIMSTTEMSTSYKHYTQQLRGSTMFHMSLGSKELFHSNFLHWISTINWDLFLKILHGLTRIKKFWWEDKNKFHPNNHNIEVRREFHHFDLSIYILDSQNKESRVDGPTSDDDLKEYSCDKGKRVVQKWIPVLILENKMKSLPYRGQLEEYTNKAFNEWSTSSLIKQAKKDPQNKTKTSSDWCAEHGITFILLSLMDTGIGQGTPEDYEVLQKLNNQLDFSFYWNHVSYRKLLTVLTKAIKSCSSSLNNLDRLVIEDYIKFLSSLCNLAGKCWKIKPKQSFRLQISPWVKESGKGNLRPTRYDEKINEIEEYKKLRIHDIHEKLLYDQLLVLLENKLVGRCARFDPKKNDELFKDGIKVFTKSDYAHGVGIFEAQFWLFQNTQDLKEHYLKLIIQVQGERYCHMVICDNVSNGAKRVNNDKKMTENLKSKIQCVWDNNLLYSIDDTISKFISIEGSTPYFQIDPDGKEEPRWGKYGNNNLYQYIDIPRDITIEEVINAIAIDIDSIFKWYLPNAFPTSGFQSLPGSM